MSLQILPLAITMMAGPQILSALLLVTSKKPLANSLAFVSGVGLTASVGVLLYTALGNALGDTVNLHDTDGPTGIAKVIQLTLVAVLIWLAIRSFRERKRPKQPAWMASLFDASPWRAFVLATTLIFLMPTDIIAMLTVGINLASNNLSFWNALPFLGLTVLIAALPLISYLLFYKRAQTFMPKVRDWMLHNSWLVNIFVYGLFVYLLLG